MNSIELAWLSRLAIALLIAARMGRFLGGSFILTLVVVVTLASFLWYLRYQRSGGGAAYDDLATRYSAMERDTRFQLLNEWDTVHATLLHTLGNESHIVEPYPNIGTDMTTGQITEAFDVWQKRAREALIKAWYADKDEAYRSTVLFKDFEHGFNGQTLPQIAAGFKERHMKPKVVEEPRRRTPSEIVQALRAITPDAIHIEAAGVENGVVRVTGRVEITDGHEMGSMADFCDRAKGLEGVSDAQVESFKSLEQDRRRFVRFVMVVKPRE